LTTVSRVFVALGKRWAKAHPTALGGLRWMGFSPPPGS